METAIKFAAGIVALLAGLILEIWLRYRRLEQDAEDQGGYVGEGP